MAIYNRDGSVYAPAGSHQLFDPNNPEHDLNNLWDEEAIRIGGAPILYYEVFIDANSIDPTYMEARSKLFSPHPVELYATYEPAYSQNDQGLFGVDSPDEVMFELNYAAVLRELGHPPKVGSRIHTPHLREDWEVVQRNRAEFKQWGGLRLQLICRRFQESMTTGSGKVIQPRADFTID